ncbi:GNAT family N-acetyltransferase [Acinetobacter sp. Tr-809]|uniref:GNAT family N-acetyltransferase n=1 Tax=Acinetobacter sp. Tr-809 TaxID=2608324 RepID=UPI00141DA975|nr:GNAT family N-acetyltransferase [Acinetobacter sp. Tr-809]NIE95064.1 GNAT family N-acetyltransferase [Acinetobacter sp. Tr-809]
MKLHQLRIERSLELPAQIDVLIQYSEREGFRFLNRLKQDFQSGTNCFDQIGEALFVVYDQHDRLIAVGGLNQDPFAESQQVGRLGRFYVHPDYRANQIGTHLLGHIEQYAKTYFERLDLFTDTAQAAQFYQSRGYQSIVSTHRNFYKILSNGVLI